MTSSEQLSWVAALKASMKSGKRRRDSDSLDSEICVICKDIEILEEHTGETEEWNTEVHDIITASLEQEKLQQKPDRTGTFTFGELKDSICYTRNWD